MSIASLYQKIKGTLEQTFQIGGKTGPTLANASGELTVNGLPISGGLRTKEVDLAFGSGGTIAALTLPANASITDVRVIVDTAFDGTPTVSLGIAGTTAKYTATTDVDLTVAGAYEMITDPTKVLANEDVILTYTAGGATVGAARVLITYGTL